MRLFFDVTDHSGKRRSRIVGSGSGNPPVKASNAVLEGAERVAELSGRSVEETTKNRGNWKALSPRDQLFHDSIKNNLRIAKPSATDEEIEAACKKASVHDFIMTLPATTRR
ncbi:MAG: hypothetical protein ACLUPM_08010 [Oscillibacter sp.]